MPSFHTLGLSVLQKIILKVLVINGHGGHLGHVTRSIFLLEAPGDQEPIIVNISHESKSVRNSEAAIWQWMCLIG